MTYFKMIVILTLIYCYRYVLTYQQKADCQKVYNERNAEFLTSYMKWRRQNYLVLLDSNVKDCGVEFTKESLKRFNEKTLYVSMHSHTTNLDTLFSKRKFKAVVVSFVKNNNISDQLIEQGNKITSYGGDRVAWLILTLSNQTRLFDVMRYVNFGLDADIVVAIRLPKMNNTQNKASESNTTNTHLMETNILLNCSEKDNDSNYDIVRYCPLERTIAFQDYFCLIQIYKIRKTYNTSLVIHPLGLWNPINGTRNLKVYMNVEKRTNFYRFPLIAGVRNTSETVSEESTAEEEELGRMLDFYRYIVRFLNSSEKVNYYIKIGDKDANGDWTDILGAVTRDEVDLGVDNIIRSLVRIKDMSFVHDIMISMRNIYVQPEQSNEFRDIYLVPFDSRLILCVLGTGIIISIALTINNNAAIRYGYYGSPNTGFIDSFIWSIGVFSQQGSIQQPKLYSGRMIMLCSLAFTLVIYNSYSAFITSVLSVQLNNIRNVDDLLNSNYEIGYAKNSLDEVYLRSTNITQLNEIYLRGYMYNNISNVTEGLLKVIKGNYGFFASSQIARKELLNISNYKCKYNIDEIPIKYTKDNIAFAVSKRSPYKRIINLSIIKMRETGVYRYIHSLINPNLQDCQQPKTYQSAGLPDLLTAFSLIFLGLIGGVGVAILECIWSQKIRLFRQVKKRVYPKKQFDVPLQPYLN